MKTGPRGFLQGLLPSRGLGFRVLVFGLGFRVRSAAGVADAFAA